MRKIPLIGMVICLITSVMPHLFAQEDKGKELEMVLYMKDKSQKRIPVESIDSISFEEKIPLQGSLTETSSLYAAWSIKAEDPDMTYNVMYLERKEFDEKYPTDDLVVQDDLTYYKELAEGYGMSLPELLESFLFSGDITDYHIGLLPGEEYVMWYYGLSLEGKQTTPLQKIYFTTTKPEAVTSKIAIKHTIADGVISVDYTPEDNNLYYTNGVILPEVAATLNDNPEAIKDVVQKGISNALADYLYNGEPISNYLEKNPKGASTKQFRVNKGDTVYLVAAFLDENCAICSEVTFVKVTMP